MSTASTTPRQAHLTDRLDDAVWAALLNASTNEREQPARDEFEGRRLRPSFAAALSYLFRPSSPLRRPGPQGQLALLEDHRGS